MSYNLMLKKTIISLACVFLSLFIFVVGYSFGMDEPKNYPQIIQKSPSPELEVSETELFDLMNEWRTAEKKRKFVWDKNLCSYAKTRAIESIEDWSHNGAKTTADSIHYDLGYNHISENLAADMYEEKDILVKWIESPSHRKNIESNFTHSCIQCEDSYCAQLFASY